MRYVDTEKLLSGDRRFDLFTETRAPDDEILKRELYNPLPLAGDRLVWGFGIARRVEALGLERMLCADIEEERPGELLRLALLLEGRAGRYTWPEKERILDFMKQYGLTDAAAAISEWVEGRREPEFISRVTLYSALDPDLKRLLDDGLIDFKTASRIRDLPHSLFEHLLGSQNALSFSERRLTSLYIAEIIRRDGLPAKQAGELVKKVFADEKPPARAATLRYPRLTDAEKRFTRFKERHLKGSGISLHAPPYYEGSEFHIEFRFRDYSQYVKRADKLSGLKENINELFQILQ
jgi:hypothetical protein